LCTLDHYALSGLDKKEDRIGLWTNDKRTKKNKIKIGLKERKNLK